MLYTVPVLLVLEGTAPAALGVAAACADAVEDEDDVAKISVCAPVVKHQAQHPVCNPSMEPSPSLNPHLLLYAGLLGWPLWSTPLTTMLFPSA